MSLSSRRQSNLFPFRFLGGGDVPGRVCAENAQAERINNTMKNELLKGKVFRNIEEVIKVVALAVDFYNNRRPHMSIGMMT